MPLPPDGQVAEFDRAVFRDVLRAAVFAADGEALRVPAPLSSVRNPDGSPQNETRAEETRRLVRTALLHLLEQNLVVFPDDILDTLDGWIPAERVGRD
jgi:hypothetical protein